MQFMENPQDLNNFEGDGDGRKSSATPTTGSSAGSGNRLSGRQASNLLSTISSCVGLSARDLQLSAFSVGSNLGLTFQNCG